MSIASPRSSYGKRSDLLTFAVLLIALLLPAPLLAARAEMVLSKVTGKVEVATAAAPEWQAAVEGMTLRAEDKIRTGADGMARVSYPDAELRVTPDATVVLGYTSVRMQVGTTWVRMRKSGRTFEILTPTVAVTIRGTLVRTTTGPGGAAVHLLTGKVDVKAGGVVQRLEPRMQIVAPVSGAALISRIDGATLVSLTREYGDLTQGKPASAPVGPPPPKTGGSSGDSGGSGGSGAGGTPGGRASAGDAGQKALAAGLQGIERDLDARSTGMGVGGGSEAAFDGPSGTSPTSGAGPGGGSFAQGTQSRTLVSRPGGAGAIPAGMASGGGGGGGGMGGGGMGGGGMGGGGGASDGNNGVGGGVGGGRENNRGRMTGRR